MPPRKSTSHAQTPLRIHFMASLDGNRDDFRRIYDLISQAGHELITDHVLNRTAEDVLNENARESRQMSKKLHAWVQQADILVYEITVPSTSIGYEIALAFTNYIPVLLLYREGAGTAPRGLRGVDNELLQILPYCDDTLPDILKAGVEFAREQLARRIYVSLTQPLLRYLNWIERTHKLNQSMYLRMLVEADMRDNRAYQAQFEEGF